MSHPARESFRQFNNLDPQARLEEFHKRFDRLKSEFQNSPRQTTMFESPGRPMFRNQPSWTESTANSHPANGHVPVEKTIPIQVQHERSRSEPVDTGLNANQASPGNSVPNNDRMHFIPENSYFQPKFPTNFAANEAANEAGEPRVVHIPIQVESRNTTAPPMAKTMPQPPMNSGHVSSQSATNQANLNQTYAAHPTSFNSGIEIPIQITKSSSTPETSKKMGNLFQGSAAPTTTGTGSNVNESASDPAIADPATVYPMGYEPLQSNNHSDKAGNNQGAAKKETAFDYVKEVLDHLKIYESQVHEFNGTTPEDKGYRFLDEMITLCMLRLDCIEIDGNDELRKYRKSAINEVTRVAAILEAKVSKKSDETKNAAAQQSESQGQSEDAVTKAQDVAQPSGSQEAEPKDKKEAKKQEKAKAKKEKEEKAKKEPGEKKEGKRILLFRGKNKNKTNQNSAATSSNAAPAAESNSSGMDVDPNNNDLKDDSNQSTSDQNSEAASTSSSTTLQGKETAV